VATLDEAVALLRDRERLLVFTGAGISTESGIPDFRGPNGVWTTVDPGEFTIDRYLGDPEVRRRAWQRRVGAAALHTGPNRGHLAVTRLWEADRVVGCVTQNVDGLHHAAGLPEYAVAQLHGTTATVTCVSCHVSVGSEVVHARLDAGEPDPACLSCGGILKTDVVFFGESLPTRELIKAEAMAADADAVLAVGTTLSVYPAAGIPLLVAERGQPFVIVNRGPTELDSLADAVVDAPAGEALEAIATALGA
jgi:NAD-dependent deacetylase